jgi:hypothetical protein
MQNNHNKELGADAESAFMANFVRGGSRKKCMYVEDTNSFLHNLQLFLKKDGIKETD